MLTSEQAFKAAFIARCADAGMGPAAMAAAADRLSDAYEKSASLTDLLTRLGGLGAAGLVVAPPALGAGAGYGLAKLTDTDDTDVADVKRQEMVDEYLRQAARLKNESAARAKRDARRPAGRILL